ncbi:MAG: restriction endonuclease subunit S [Methyloprofundus sp.]|nr:restriction endonuclease subunit S [Methyloprofundus sp.]
MLPEGWKRWKVSEVLQRVSNPVDVDPSKAYRQIGIRSHGKGLFYKELVLGSDLGNKRVFHIKSGCFIVNIVFAWEQAIAKTTEAELGMIASHRFPMFEPKKNFCDIDFILYYFKTKKGKYLLELASPGGAGRNKTLGQSEFLKLDLLLPHVSHQKKIAQILSTWDNAISATERLLENSQQRKKALMQQLLTGKKRLPGFEGEWSTVKLGDLGDTYGGLTGKTKEDFGSGEPYITYMSVFADGAIIPDKFDYVKLKEGEKQHSVEYGDILFTTSSETPEEVGMASVMLERLPLKVYLNSFCFGFRLSSLDVLIPEYAKYYMRSEGIRRAIANLAQGATRYNLSKRQLLKISLHLPCVSEQQAIANVLTTADQEIDAIQKRLDHLKQEKKALMQQLLTGKRRVKVEEAA